MAVGETSPAVRSCAEVEFGDHLLGLRRFGQHRLLGLDLLPDLVGDEVDVPRGGRRGLGVGRANHPAARKSTSPA